MKINFTATAEGNTSLTLTVQALDSISPYPDYTITSIEYTIQSGSVTVIPEFPTILIMPLLLITTLAAAFLGKMVWSRKRKDALISE